MNKGKTKIWLRILFMFAIAISFYIGGVIGFDKGFRASEYFKGIDAFYTVTILERVRDDRKDNAILLLEGKLDGQLFNLGFYEDNRSSVFGLIYSVDIDSNLGKSTKNIMKKVVEYRKKYPSMSDDEKLLKIINKTLNKYNE